MAKDQAKEVFSLSDTKICSEKLYKFVQLAHPKPKMCGQKLSWPVLLAPFTRLVRIFWSFHTSDSKNQKAALPGHIFDEQTMSEPQCNVIVVKMKKNI
jgi:hypothetical protein